MSSIMSSKVKKYYRKNPVAFIDDYIFSINSGKYGGNLSLSAKQIMAMESIANTDNTTIEICRDGGKTAVAALIALWRIAVFPKSKTLVVGQNHNSLQYVFWPEVKKWLNGSLLKNYITQTGSSLYITSKGKYYSSVEYSVCKNAISGIHGSNTLIIADNADTISDDVLSAIHNALTGNNDKFLALIDIIK